MTLFYFSIFIISFIILVYSSKGLVASINILARFLGWKEFVVAFFTMAIAATIPNLTIGISSALHKIPHLSYSEITGGNIIDLTITMALAVLISKRGLKLVSRTVQGTAISTLLLSILSLILTLDKEISRIDGLILILSFIMYSFWLFGRKDRFSKIYKKTKKPLGLKGIFHYLFEIIFLIILLLLAAECIVRSVIYFSSLLNLPLVLIGVLIVSLGNALPELFFSVQAVKKGKSWMVAGNLMGAVIFPMTLVVGLVALICPIKVSGLSVFVIGRLFLIIAAVFFLIFIRTGKRITKKEAVFLLFIYFAFILTEVLFYI
ncbi:hypothetical protein KKE74_00300 [Patescibacteria group bacterium]|nr:hypothetical protein [Patescibacteria group bacterium]